MDFLQHKENNPTENIPSPPPLSKISISSQLPIAILVIIGVACILLIEFLHH